MKRYSWHQSAGYKVNWFIKAPEIRLLEADGKQIGIMSLKKAQELAQEKQLDLVEIAARAKPPVVKLIDFAKFKYLEKKKKKEENKKGQRGGELKEIRMTPFIGQEDLDTRVKKAKKFLNAGNKVKIGIKFKGRQNARREFGFDLIEKFGESLQEIAQKEGEAKKVGRMIFQTFTAIPKTKKRKNEDKKEKVKN